MGEVRDSLADERLMLRADFGELVPVAGSEAIAPVPTGKTPAFQWVAPIRLLRQLTALRSEVTDLVERESALGTAFNFVPVSAGLGAVIYFTVAVEPGYAPAVLAFVFALVTAQFLGERRVFRATCLAIAAISGGMVFAKFETVSRQSILLGEQITTRVTGRVLSLEATPRGQRAVIEVLSTEKPSLRFQPSRIKVTLRKIPDGLKPGDAIKALFLLRPPSGPVRPGSFDFAFDSYFDRIGASGVSLSAVERVDAPKPGVLRQSLFWFERQRVAIANTIRARIVGQSGEMSAALITGLGGGISAETNEAMRMSGLAHVTSISGLHMALVAGSVMGGMRLILALFPQFASRHPIKKFAAACALAGALIYLLLSGGGVATVRSFIMLAVMLVAVLFDRPAITMRNLVIAALIILVFAPHEIMGPSFQMSFAATAALIASYQLYSQWRLDRTAGNPLHQTLVQKSVNVSAMFVLGILATSLVAGLATAVYSAFHFNRIAPMGLIANLIAMPVVSIIVMPMALLSVLLMPLGLESPPLWLMGKGVDFMLAVADWAASLSSSGNSGIVPMPAFALFTAAILVFCLLNTKLRLAALPLAAIALALCFARTVPDILISEDAKLVAMRAGGSDLLVNQKRPNRFTLDNWQRAYGASEITNAGFECGDGLCLAKSDFGVQVGHLTDKALFEDACGRVDLLVVTAPLEEERCAPGEAFVITARQLARHGAAEVRFVGGTGDRPRLEVSYSIESLDRPWQRHRQFSRAARNMEPYVSKKKAAPEAAASTLDAASTAD